MTNFRLSKFSPDLTASWQSRESVSFSQWLKWDVKCTTLLFRRWETKPKQARSHITRSQFTLYLVPLHHKMEFSQRVFASLLSGDKESVIMLHYRYFESESHVWRDVNIRKFSRFWLFKSVAEITNSIRFRVYTKLRSFSSSADENFYNFRFVVREISRKSTRANLLHNL